MSRKGFAAALLLAALSARAQVEVRPAVVLPPSAGAFVLAPSAAFAPTLAPILAPALSPSLAASAFAPATPPAAAAAALLLPVEAHAAAMSGALAEFAKTDLESAAPGQARDAGEALMLRVLGASAPSPAAGPVEAATAMEAPALLASSGGEEATGRTKPKVYLLSKPLRETVRLGPLALALHLAYSVMWEVIKAGVTYKATGSVTAAATVFAFEFATSPVMLTARSLGHLGLRYWRRKLGVLKELARTPGLKRVKVLTTGDVTFMGPLARRKDNTGLIFVEADGPLPESLGRFGAPIPLGDAAASRVRLVYVQGGKTSPSSWSPTLEEMLEGRPIPSEIAASWRAAANDSKPALAKMLDISGAKGKARLEATLIGADGGERVIGAISEGPAARALIGLGLLDRARAFLGRELPSRSIPISDSAVERSGDARESGAPSALRRAWRRLTGRLIVAPK